MKRIKNFYLKHERAINAFSAIFGIGFGLFAFFFPFTIKPRLKYYLGNVSVLARTDKKIDSLTIIYKNRDITKDSMHLLATNVRIVNKSRADLKEDDFVGGRFGLKIYNCKIIGVEVVQKKGDYLSENLNPRIVDSATVEFNKVAFDSKSEVRLVVYLLHRNRQRPDYYPIGKISGVKEIEIWNEGEDVIIDWDELLVPLLGAGLIILIELPLILLFVFSYNVIQKSYRKNQIFKLYQFPLKELNDVQIVFVKLYKLLGKKRFLQLLEGLKEGEEYIEKEQEFIQAHKKVNQLRGKLFFIFRRTISYNSPFYSSIDELMESKLILKDVEENYKMTPELVAEAANTLELFKKKMEVAIA